MSTLEVPARNPPSCSAFPAEAGRPRNVTLHTLRLPRIGPRRDLGHDPDYRFTLANERTFLAWIRTALALIAGGLAVFQFIPDVGIEGGREALGASLIALGTVLAVGSVIRWAAAEDAMRQDRAIPATRLPVVLAIGVMVVTVMVVVLLLTD